ncbi:MAG: CCA tRNA nucleotidyltransferase [Candidatus Bipolaricaulota bacterium]
MQLDPSPVFKNHPFAEEIITRLQDGGYTAVLIGGVVRDYLREQFEACYKFDPAQVDVDIATDAPPEEIKKTLSDRKTLEVGEQFGVIVVVGPEGRNYEIAQFRTEENYDGRRPGTVERATSLDEDVRRRDFTVNALAMKDDGTILDYVDGIRDLKGKVIRAIGDPDCRMQEDLLRTLRAIRFACYLDARIEQDTYRAVKEAAPRIQEISRERIGEEILKILGTNNAGRGMELLQDCSLMEELIPEMAENVGVEQPEEYHPEGDVFAHSIAALKVADKLNFDPLVKLAVFLHDVGKAQSYLRHDGEHSAGHEKDGAKMTEKICRGLRFSNDQTELVTWLVENHMKAGLLPRMNRAKQVRLIISNQDKNRPLNDIRTRFPRFTALLQVLIADSQGSAHLSSGWLSSLKEFAELLPHIRELEKREDAREMLNGNDILEMGVPQGPRIGELLEKIHRKIYAGEIISRAEALREARRLVQEDEPGDG